MIFKDIKIRQKKPYSEQQADAKENFPQHRSGWKQSFMFGEKRFCGMDSCILWWRQRDSNPRPQRCERCALPTELCPHRKLSALNDEQSAYRLSTEARRFRFCTLLQSYCKLKNSQIRLPCQATVILLFLVPCCFLIVDSLKADR